MSFQSTASRAALALALLVGGCGGGGGDSGSSAIRPPVQAPSPTPGPSPSPTPSPTPVVAYPPAPFGITGPQGFTTLGWLTRNESREVVALSQTNFLLRWIAQPATYEMTVPDLGTGQLRYTYPGNNPFAFTILASDGSELGSASLTDGRAMNPPSRYVGYVRWEGETAATGTGSLWAAFGLGTTPSQVPVSGAYQYQSLEWSKGAAVTIDFGAGTASGEIRIAWTDAWGPYPSTAYPLTNVILGPGRTGFTAEFAVPGAPSRGTVSAQLMGPGAQEIAIAWKTPLKSPYEDVWVMSSGIILGSLAPVS